MSSTTSLSSDVCFSLAASHKFKVLIRFRHSQVAKISVYDETAVQILPISLNIAVGITALVYDTDDDAIAVCSQVHPITDLNCPSV